LKFEKACATAAIETPARVAGGKYYVIVGRLPPMHRILHGQAG
jgi:hypothetical protein